MTQSEKLEALVERAVEGGWDAENYIAWKNGNRENILAALVRDEVWKQFIFNHDFAKALFGEQEIKAEKDSIPVYGKRLTLIAMQIAWQHYLQQAVIASSPIDYMYTNIEEES